MDSLGEVGKKMRSAIKAKLVELGNASSTGYIDDELPDYVMIMVANKRPKQQMLVDLNLFLGSNTETFVNWLHQVLQKLQEVTLPTNLATKAKKKISESSTKKDKKKDKKKHPKEPSITDVIAVELMEKAKKTIDPKVKCEKTEKSRTPSPPPVLQINNNSNSDKIDKQPVVSSSQAAAARSSNKSDDDLNIPTLSEIRLNKSSNLLHKKELGDLQNIEKKIQELKRNRRAISGPEQDNNKQKEKEKELSDQDEEMDVETSPENNSSQKEKGGVKSRLGTKQQQQQPTEATNNSKSGNIISLSAIRRSETEFLKKIVVKQKEDNERKVDDYRSVRNNRHESNSSRNYSRRDRRSRSNSRDRHRTRSDRIDRFRRRSRSRSPIKHENRSRMSIRDRIGDKIQSSSSSAVINRKHSKTPEVPDGNFKVKSRPALSSAISTHAGKNMLLRAMADAQRSTQASSDAKKRQRDNITVQVKNEKRNQSHQNDEEYVPESISGHSESEAEYHPSYVKNQNSGEDDEDVIYLNNNDDVDLDDLEDNNEMPKASPQFIVTLNDKDLGTINRAKSKEKSKSKSHSPTPPKVIKRNKRTPVKERIGDRVSSNRTNKEHDHRQRKRQHQDAEMEVEESEAQRAYNKVKKTRVSPIKFDLTDDEDGRNSRSSSRDPSEKKSSISKNDSDHNGEEHTKRIKLEASRSFDHVPALLSSIAVPIPDSAKPVVVTKSKDRCKFYPNCVNSNCIYYHPTLPCKAFPNCKFGDSCSFTHPPCKFDRSCHRGDCNYTHSAPILPASTPVIASSIVPVQNYKSITLTPTMQVCKFFPSCTNTNCIYQHPKVCKFGKACANKYECNFYHFETASKSKFRWVSSSS